MTNQLTHLRRAVKKFHENEAGFEVLQVVMIIAVSAIVLLFVKTNWESVKTWANDLIQQILGWTQ